MGMTWSENLHDRFSYNGAQGVQWLSGSVLDSRSRSRRFKPHRCQCVVVFEQDIFILA